MSSPYGSDASLVGMAMAAPPPYPDSIQPVSLLPYPSSVPAVPSVGSPQGYHHHLDYYSASVPASQPPHSAALYLQPVAANPEFGAGTGSAVPAGYAGYPCLQYSPLVLSPGLYSIQAPGTGARPTLVGHAPPGPAYTVPPPPTVVVPQSPMEQPTAVAALPPQAANQTPVQLVPMQGQLLCNVARVQAPQVAARQLLPGALC